MDIVYIISRSTRSNSNNETHADNGNGKPICDDKPRGKFNGWSRDKGDVTCKKCLEMLKVTPA